MSEIEIKKYQMCITINTVESCMGIPDYMITEERSIASLHDEHLSMMSELKLHDQ